MWKPVERRRIAEEVARQLRSLILQGRYKPGDKLPPERKLSESLGVNRATLREALRNLEHMGLVSIRQGDGTRVLDFIQTAGLDILGHLISLSGSTRREVLRDMLELREIAGREMARLAAQRADAEQLAGLERLAGQEAEDREAALLLDLDFYFELSRATGNLVFPLLYNPMRAAVRRFSRFFVTLSPDREAVRLHHHELLEALRQRQPERASRSAARHLRWGRDHLFTVENDDEAAVVTATPDPVDDEPPPLR